MARGIVSVFGGSSPKPGSEAYEEAYVLGKMLAQAGYAVATGGYTGTMEAASKGAAEVGGHVIGVTCDALNIWETAGVKPNQWVVEEVRFSTLRERLCHLVEFCDAVISLRGGIGTLSEVSLTWSLIQVREIEPKPLILLGKVWGDILTRFYGNGEYIRPEHMALWQCVETPEEALALVHNHR